MRWRSPPSHEESAVRIAAAAPVAQEILDPLEHDPESLGLVLIRGDSQAEAKPSGDGSLFAVATPEPPREPVEQLDAELAQAARHGGVTVRRGPSDAPHQGAPRGEASELFDATLPRIELREAPLVEAVGLLSELAGAPVTLNPNTLRLAGVDPMKRVSLDLVDRSLDDALTEVLKQARLVRRYEGAHTIAELKDADTPKTVTHRLTDLSGDGPQQLATLLEASGPAGIDYGMLTPSRGELPCTARRQTQYALLILCERLRVARALPQQSKYPLRLLAVEPSQHPLAPKLTRRTTFSFVTPTPLVEVFAHWRETSGLKLLVDWRSLADAGLGPRSTILCSATNRSWRDALDGVLDPLGLAWTPGGADTLWIASREQIEAETTVEFYPMDPALAEAWTRRLAEDHPSASGGLRPREQRRDRPSGGIDAQGVLRCLDRSEASVGSFVASLFAIGLRALRGSTPLSTLRRRTRWPALDRKLGRRHGSPRRW